MLVIVCSPIIFIIIKIASVFKKDDKIIKAQKLISCTGEVMMQHHSTKYNLSNLVSTFITFTCWTIILSGSMFVALEYPSSVDGVLWIQLPIFTNGLFYIICGTIIGLGSSGIIMDILYYIFDFLPDPVFMISFRYLPMARKKKIFGNFTC